MKTSTFIFALILCLSGVNENQNTSSGESRTAQPNTVKTTTTGYSFN